MYVFELSDIMFFINNIKNPTPSFNISSCISFSHSGTRSAGLRLKHNISYANKQRHFYFNRICRLWNSLPIINLNLSILTTKNQQRQFFSGNTSLKTLTLLILINYIIYAFAALVSTTSLQTLIMFCPVIDVHFFKS